MGTSLGVFYSTGLAANQRGGNSNNAKNEAYYNAPYGQQSSSNPEGPAMKKSTNSERSHSQSQRYEQRRPTPRQQSYEKNDSTMNNYSLGSQQMNNNSKFSQYGTQSLLLPQISDR